MPPQVTGAGKRKRDLDAAIVALTAMDPKKSTLRDRVSARDIEIANDFTFKRISDVCSHYNVDDKTARSAQDSVSYSGFQKTLDTLDHWRDEVEACGDGVLAIHRYVAFDGAKSQMTVPVEVGGVMSTDLGCGSMSWNNMVSKRGPSPRYGQISKILLTPKSTLGFKCNGGARGAPANKLKAKTNYRALSVRPI